MFTRQDRWQLTPEGPRRLSSALSFKYLPSTFKMEEMKV